jgi:hypothetical protein
MIKERYLDGLESLERGWIEDILMAETLTTITPPSSIGLERYLDRLFLYILTGEIFYISLSMRDIAGGTFLGKYTSGQFSSLTIFSLVHRWIGL